MESKDQTKPQNSCPDAAISSNNKDGSDPNKISKYLSAEQLTRDPLENAARRRNMLDEDEDEDLDADGWRITREMMDRIDNSDWLRKELSDGGLRQIIAQIDMADDEEENYQRRKKRPKLGAIPDLSPRETALMKARHSNPKFSNFIDRLLVTSKVLVEGEKTTEQELASFLLGDKMEVNGMLSLAPVIKRRQTQQNKVEIDGDSVDSDPDSVEDDDSESSRNESQTD